MKKYQLLKILSVLFLLSLSSYLVAYDNYQVQLMTVVKNNEEKLNSLSQQMNYIQDRCATLESEVNKLNRIVSADRQNDAQTLHEMATLKQQLGESKAQMQKTLDSAVDKIANETSKAINGAVKSSKSSHTPASSPAVTGKFYVYKVQEGATLTTIAKAYKVSVESIKKANKLKSNILSTGQTLHIPKTN